MARAEVILEESEKRSGEWPLADSYSYYALMRHHAEKGHVEKVQEVSRGALCPWLGQKQSSGVEGESRPVLLFEKGVRISLLVLEESSNSFWC